MSRTLFTLLAILALATCLAVAQDQPAQSQPGQTQAAPQSQQAPMPPSQQAPEPQTQQAPESQPQAPAHQGQKGMSSQQLQSAFQSTFQRYPELSNVKVKVADDKIEFSGTVPSQTDKEKVRRTAEANADGRKVVDDDLKVSGGEGKPATPPPPSAPPQ